MIDRHQPAVSYVELGAHRVDGRLALHDFVHAVEVAPPAVAGQRALFLQGEVQPDRGISDQGDLEAQENGRGDEPNPDERRIDPGDRADGRANAGDLRVLAVQRIRINLAGHYSPSSRLAASSG